MKNLKKALAMVLTLAAFAALPALAEAPAAEAAAVEVQPVVAVETLLGTDIDEAGTALGLEKTQTQGAGEFDAYLTLYENEDITLGGRDGVVTTVYLFNDSYSIFGVRLGMTVKEAKTALNAAGISCTDGKLVEMGTDLITFTVPGNDKATVTFEFGGGKVVNADISSESDAE